MGYTGRTTPRVAKAKLYRNWKEQPVDQRGRFRNKTVGFRVSEEEWDILNKKIDASGLLKQDYLLRKLVLDEAIVVNLNSVKTLKHISNQLDDIYLFFTNKGRKNKYLCDEKLSELNFIINIIKKGLDNND